MHINRNYFKEEIEVLDKHKSNIQVQSKHFIDWQNIKGWVGGSIGIWSFSFSFLGDLFCFSHT